MDYINPSFHRLILILIETARMNGKDILRSLKAKSDEITHNMVMILPVHRLKDVFITATIVIAIVIITIVSKLGTCVVLYFILH